jgi:hypothetical protein
MSQAASLARLPFHILCVPKTYLNLAFWFAFGAPSDGPPCILQRPFGIAGDWQGFPLRVLAPRGRPPTAVYESGYDPGCVKRRTCSVAIEQVIRLGSFWVLTSQAPSNYHSNLRTSFSPRFELLSFHTA